MITVYDLQYEQPQKRGPKVILSADPPPDPPIPSEAPVQDILFQPPALDGLGESLTPYAGSGGGFKKAGSGRHIVSGPEPVILSFVMVDSHIAPSMRRQIRHIYALYGRQGLRALKEALFGNPDSHWNLRGESHTRNTDRPDFNREYVEAVLNRPPEAVAAQRNRLLAQYEVEVANLDKLLESVSSALEQRAHRLVNGRLAESRAEVVKEGLRYITQSKDTLIQVFETLHSFPMTGNEVLALAKAVVRIDDARLRLNEAERLQQEISAPAAAKRADWISSQLAQTAFADPTGLGYYEPRSVTELEEQASAFFPDTSGMLRAAEISAQKKTDFLNVVAAEAVTFPILFRLWEPADLAAPLRTKLAKAVKFRGFDADDEFSRAVVGVLSAAWKAVNGCQSRIANKTFNVWRYPPVITEALTKLAIPRGTVEWQGANEISQNHGEGASWVSKLSTLAGIFQLGAAVTGAAPPIAAAIETVALVLQSAEWLETLWRAGEDSDDFNSSLDPAASFGCEPSYVGVIVGLAFVGLQARDAARAVKTIYSPLGIP